MILKIAKVKIVQVAETLEEIRDKVSCPERLKRRLASLPPIQLDPKRYLYLRNRSISAMETYGPNQNGDAFPREELIKGHLTFIGAPLTLDHISDLVVGSVIDSHFVPLKNGDGDYVENILALDKKEAERISPGLVDHILNGSITDTSMGVLVDYSVCSVCKNKAYEISQYCSHVKFEKGSKVVLASGEEKLVYEINYGLKFLEDSIIRPIHLGGLAGGEGADPYAKLLEAVVLASKRKDFPLADYLRNRMDQKRYWICEYSVREEKDRERNKSELPGESKGVIPEPKEVRAELVEKEEIPEIAVESLMKKLMEGKQFQEALAEIEEIYFPSFKQKFIEEMTGSEVVAAIINFPGTYRIKERIRGSYLLEGDEGEVISSRVCLVRKSSFLYDLLSRGWSIYCFGEDLKKVLNSLSTLLPREELERIIKSKFGESESLDSITEEKLSSLLSDVVLSLQKSTNKSVKLLRSGGFWYLLIQSEGEDDKGEVS